MKDIRVGDSVKCMRATEHNYIGNVLTKGKIYKITNAKDHYISIKVNYGEILSFPNNSCFKLIESNIFGIKSKGKL